MEGAGALDLIVTRIYQIQVVVGQQVLTKILL